MEFSYLLKRSVRRYKSNICIVCGETRLTFHEVGQRANSFANGLLSLGLKVGDRVSTLLNNTHQYIEIYLALAKTGLARVPLNSRESFEEHTFKIVNCQVNTLIFGEEFMEFVASCASNLPTVKHFICVRKDSVSNLQEGILDYEKIILSSSTEEPEVQVNGDAIYRMTHTGGTTGRPKPAIMTHKAEFEFLTNMLLNVAPMKEDDVFLHVHPLSHGTACLVLPCIIRGATQVISPSTKPDQILKTIEKERVTTTWLVPATIIALLNYPELIKYDFRSLRKILYGAAPMPVARIKDAIKVFGPIFGQIYGQAEIPFCATFLYPEEHVIEGPEEKVRRLASCGRETDRVMVRIVDSHDRDVPTGEVGEIVAKSSHMMAGYWNNPSETAEVLKDGWVHTKDMGWMDDEGYIYLVDRKSHMIISGGFNVYPKEIEDVLYTHPSIREVAVIGIPDDQWGEAVKAVVVFRMGQEATEEELIAYCKKFLGKYKVPKSIDISTGELPKTSVGKVDKKAIKKNYWKNYERWIH